MKSPLSLFILKNLGILCGFQNLQLICSIHAWYVLLESTSFIEAVGSRGGSKKLSLNIGIFLDLLNKFFLKVEVACGKFKKTAIFTYSFEQTQECLFIFSIINNVPLKSREYENSVIFILRWLILLFIH